MNTRLMCKLYLKDGSWIIFEAVVLWSVERRQRSGFETSLGILAITDKDREKLDEVMKA